MTRYDYKVVPAPERGKKAPGVRSPAARLAFALERLMNDMAADGWEYQRCAQLPSEERSGWTGTVTRPRTLLVFRRDRSLPTANDAGLSASGLTPDHAGTAGLGVAGLPLAAQMPDDATGR